MEPEQAAAEFVPATARLAGSIASAVGYGHLDTGLHRGLPSPYLTFIFSLADPIVTGWSPEQASGTDAYRNNILVGGLHLQPAYIAPSPRQVGIQLAVFPLAARTIFGVPAKELAVTVEHGTAVLGAPAERLRQRLLEPASWDMRFALLSAYLRQRERTAGAPVRADLGEAWRWLARRRGAGSLDGLTRHVGLSGRQLDTLFDREFGVSPKQASRLMRFDHARRLVTAAVIGGRPRDLSGVAASCGFYDHAHLIRDFRQFTGLSPTGWLQAERGNIQAGGQWPEEE